MRKRNRGRGTKERVLIVDRYEPVCLLNPFSNGTSPQKQSAKTDCPRWNFLNYLAVPGIIRSIRTGWFTNPVDILRQTSRRSLGTSLQNERKGDGGSGEEEDSTRFTLLRNCNSGSPDLCRSSTFLPVHVRPLSFDSTILRIFPAAVASHKFDRAARSLVELLLEKRYAALWWTFHRCNSVEIAHEASSRNEIR